MSTTRSFSTMLNEYLPNKLLKEELIKRVYLLNKVEKDDTWKTGNLVVPFKGAGASSIAFGSLTADTDVAEDVYVRGGVSSPKEVWGTMIFNHRDLMEHDKLSEQNLLKILPDTIDDFMEYFKSVVSMNLLNGAYFATATADGDASGNLTVDRPDRFVIGQKVQIDDDNSSPVDGYVRTIVMDTSVVTFFDARSGGSAVNLSTYTVAQNARVYNDGQQLNGFSSLKSMLLSSANGGGSTLYGQTKTAYPYLQAINIDGSPAGLNIGAANIVSKLFDAYTTTRIKGKGKPMDILMSFKNFGSVIKAVEASKGSFNVVPNSRAANQYGWDTITIGSVSGSVLNFVGIQEMDDDVISFIDWKALKFYSNGFFRKRKSPDGIEFFEKRATSGYSYIVDMCLFGELILQRPSYCGIVYGISY